MVTVLLAVNVEVDVLMVKVAVTLLVVHWGSSGPFTSIVKVLSLD